jgi:hypothetical protein
MREIEFQDFCLAIVDRMTPVRERYTPFPRYFEVTALNFLVMRTAILALLLLSATRVAAGRPVYLSGEAAVAQAWYSCPSKDDLQFLKSLPAEKWRAARSYADAHDCRILKTGDTGIVADASVWTGNTCLRIKATKACYWFPEAYVIPANSPGQVN